MDDSDVSGDELQNALHQRLVATGEWNRLLMLMKRMLDDCGWETSLREHASERAKAQEKLSLPDLLNELGPYAKSTLPTHVKNHMTSLLRDFLDRNLEDA
ncbi:hypothetical protein IE53DRAFT_383110 [Violaceomyces palustris]|uniref:Uncharacterized protein n=1 Tax=Violaceomyces palustris TaxID=1673888 RepID=A0ACD0P8M8_9BASI|nr:hypothetical protein IE53DRAFT_383110 [Violaceomyces palustris]